MEVLFDVGGYGFVVGFEDCEAVSLGAYAVHVYVGAGKTFRVDEVSGETGTTVCLVEG